MNLSILKSIHAFLQTIPNKRFARFTSASDTEKCRCVMGTLFNSHYPHDTWVIQDINGYRWASPAVEKWATEKGLTFEMVNWLIEVNDFEPNAYVLGVMTEGLKRYVAETPAERYERVMRELARKINVGEALGVE